MRTSRNLRIVLVAERHGTFRVGGAPGEPLPTAHVREGESLRYAASLLARRMGIDIRGLRILGIIEREGRRPNDRTVDLYLYTTVIAEREPTTAWASRAMLAHDVPPEILAATTTAGAPYLGVVAFENAT